MTLEEICKEGVYQPFSLLQKYKLLDEIVEKTSFLDNSDYKNLFGEIIYSQRIFHIRNNDFSIHYCPYCGKMMNFNKHRGYVLHKECMYLKIKETKKANDSDRKGYEKQKKNNLLKYGVEHLTQTEEFKEKRRETNIERYGTEIPSQSQEIKKKIKETNLSKYSAKTILQSREIEEKTASSYPKLKFIPRESSFSMDYHLGDFIKSNYDGEIIENYKINSNFSMQYYLPELNLGIELLNLHQSSSEFQDNNYNRIKSKICKEKGVHVVYIFEDDWNNKRDICKSIISNFINNSAQTSIYARKCEIREIEKIKECNDFLNNNHLLGSIATYSVCYGLYYKNELVSLMSFKLLKKETMQYELNRYAIKQQHRIIGGAEKLLSAFIKDYNGIARSIITYNDNSVFKGRIYEKLGFRFVRTNSPNYMFISKESNYSYRFPKQSIRKLNIGFKIETELEIGYLRVYNAGNDVYIIE